ncbi:MAG TPA: TrmH family RNA methyltransferase [Candidatus Dojkabacteria bacterium]|jgi:tRNA G18 (ribose-2'-O)-methylase SpoU
MEQLRGIDLKRFLRRVKKPDIELFLLLENIQYAKNVASIFRTAEAFFVKKIFLTGISKTPPFGKDLKKASRNKEEKVHWEYKKTTGETIQSFKNRGFEIVSLEITDKSENIAEFKPKKNTLLIVGNETYGVTKETLERSDKSVFIPMFGKGSSLNVSSAAAVALNNLISNSRK